MRLTTILMFGKKPIGFKYRGKNRVVKEIKDYELRQLKADYERTEQNMLVLRYPYLSVQQSHGHMAHVDRYTNFISARQAPRDARFADHITLADRLIHLRCNEAWD